MATRIIEYGGDDRSDVMQAVPYQNVYQTSITPSGTSQQSAAFNAGTTMICIQADEAICVTRGPNPTATTSHYRIGAGSEQFFSAKPGDKVAVIATT